MEVPCRAQRPIFALITLIERIAHARLAQSCAILRMRYLRNPKLFGVVPWLAGPRQMLERVEAVDEGTPRDPEQLGCACLVATGLFQGLDEILLDVRWGGSWCEIIGRAQTACGGWRLRDRPGPKLIER